MLTHFGVAQLPHPGCTHIGLQGPRLPEEAQTVHRDSLQLPARRSDSADRIHGGGDKVLVGNIRGVDKAL